MIQRFLSFLQSKIDQKADDIDIDARRGSTSINITERDLRIVLCYRWFPLRVNGVAIPLGMRERLQSWRFIRSAYRQRRKADRDAFSAILDTLTAPTR